MNPQDGGAPGAPGGARPPPNRLINEKSPYLLQHAYNPVDWHPWGEEAFSRARQEGKPVFLSIGYSTCHWCHVMAEESFADPEVAGLLNETFVCIKVDREERPEIDQVYMAAAQALTDTLGWPLTIIMTPDKKPFFAASYIPKESRYGMTGLIDLIPRIRRLWETRRQDLENTGNLLLEALQNAARTPQNGPEITKGVLDEAYSIFLRIFDRDNGGFGNPPWFPAPHNLIFLLRYWSRTGKEPAYMMAAKTLSAMRQGGIFDQIGYGFHRYSTDAEWFVPHFEKMLYDQALLALAYTEAFLASGREEFERTARETITYVLRDMTDPGGGFYSAEDADSEGEEGRFYLWTKDEILELLGEEDGEMFSRIFGVTGPGNYLEQPGGRRTGRNILRLRRPLSALAEEFETTEEELAGFVEEARKKLFAFREQRVHPAKDDKILTDWNALMIAALARAARVFDDPEYLAAAERATAFLLNNLRRPDGRLLHRYRQGEAGLAATLDDCAFMLLALIEDYEASFSPKYLQTALELANDLIEHYQDPDNGGFFFVPDDADTPVRQKPVYDGATPSGNSAAMYALYLLGRMTANLELEETAERIHRALAGSVTRSPAASPSFLTGVELMLGEKTEVIIAGVPGAEDTAAMVRKIYSHYIPGSVVILRPSGEETPEIAEIAGFTRDMVMIGGRATAYVCTNHACRIPTTDPDKMLQAAGTGGIRRHQPGV